MTIRQKVEEKLKEKWYSNFQIDMECKSSSANRELRRIRENPPEGYKIIQRPKKKVVGYNACLEYKLVKEGDIDGKETF